MGIAMPPNNAQSTVNVPVQSRISVPSLPQLPQLPSNGVTTNNANAIQSNLPSFAPQQTQRQSSTHRQSVRHSQQISPQRRQQRSSQRAQQQTQPAFPSFGGSTSVPP